MKTWRLFMGQPFLIDNIFFLYLLIICNSLALIHNLLQIYSEFCILEFFLLYCLVLNEF